VRAQGHDRVALESLLRALQLPLHRHISAIVRDPDLAEDVLQEVLWLVCRKLARLRDPRWIRAWAYRIATREAHRRLRRERMTSPLDDAVLATLEAPALERSPDLELLARIPALVERLSPASALVIRMHYLERLSIAEIAEALELAPGTVKSRLAYGLATLRRSVAIASS